MKITHLSSTEVANISVLPIELRKTALLEVEEPSVRWGYSPVTDALPKLLLASSPLFGDLPSGDDDLLIESIRKECKSGPKQVAACEAVAKAIIDWRNKNGVRGRIVYTEPLRMSVDTLKYCCDVVAIVEGAPYVLYLDPRSSMTLSVEGREFIKSLIYHTALIGDLRDAKTAVLRIPAVKPGVRRAVFEPFGGSAKYSLEEILVRVTETYSIWETILRGRKSGKAEEA